jgi:hypothetical protein
MHSFTTMAWWMIELYRKSDKIGVRNLPHSIVSAYYTLRCAMTF